MQSFMPLDNHQSLYSLISQKQSPWYQASLDTIQSQQENPTRSILSKIKSVGIVSFDAIGKDVRLLAHRICSSLAEISTGGLGFCDALGEEGSIFVLDGSLVKVSGNFEGRDAQPHPWFSQHYGASMQRDGACAEDVGG